MNVPSGDWDANSFTNFLNSSLGPTYSFLYDSANLRIVVTPTIEINEGTTCQRLLGLPEGWLGTFSHSLQPINFRTVTKFNIDTNLSLYNSPVSGRLCTIGVTTNYGDLEVYQDQSGALPVLMMNHQLSTLEVMLTDQESVELTCFESTPWYLTLELQEVEGMSYDTLFERL